MKLHEVIGLLFSCSLLVSCTTNHIANINNPVIGEKAVLSNSYTLILPKEFQIVAVSTGKMDFDVYELKDRSGKVLSKIYLGNAPDTSLVKRKKHQFSNFKTEYFKGIEKTKTCGINICGEVLVFLDNNKGWPQFAHIIFNDLTGGELKSVERVVYSLAYE
ncbi:hypothetical protein [Acinetobacter sp. P8-3-8]|uniref:hypothetical protein n=1 Tax=Acinetobacter sp. P8-3-8 TaxID=1029823 RepID=UPI0002486C97|nr:hypothetical protein [Acinetobacter sp. P8-3-8]